MFPYRQVKLTCPPTTNLGYITMYREALLVQIFKRIKIAIPSRRAGERAICLASVVLKNVIDCILDFHRMGHPSLMIMKPVQECVDKGSKNELMIHDLANSALT